MYGLDERLMIARVSLFNFSDGVRFESGLTVIDGPEFDYLRCSNKPIMICMLLMKEPYMLLTYSGMICMLLSIISMLLMKLPKSHRFGF